LEQQAARFPDRILSLQEDEHITYQTFNERANQLARSLRLAGLKPGSFVAVNMLRSLHLHVALFAIWKCGAGYVPLDPSYPAQRKKIILEDSQVKMVLTQRGLERIDTPCAFVRVHLRFFKISYQHFGLCFFLV